jgi:integrase
LATFKQLSSGHWRAQVRRKGRYLSQTFKRNTAAQEWARAIETRIDRGETPTRMDRLEAPPPTAKIRANTFGQLIDLHVQDMKGVGRAPRRSKDATLQALNAQLGGLRLDELTRERFIQFGRDRARRGAGPVTVNIDFSYIRLVISHAAAVHGVAVSPEPVELARIALKRLGIIGKSRARERRPTANELERLIGYLDANPRQLIPMGRIVRFAVATAMRQDEITRVRWADIDAEGRTIIVRDRKDPRDKTGNDQKTPLLDATGFDAWALIEEQKSVAGRDDCVFPYNGRSIGAAFRRACRELGIDDLHFHDLRHEAASRLFEAGLSIEQVALVTGHKDWKMLKRYTHLRPEHLYRRQIALAEYQTAPRPAPALPAAAGVTFSLSAQWGGNRPAIGVPAALTPLAK